MRRRLRSYSVRYFPAFRLNADQNNSKYGYISRSILIRSNLKYLLGDNLTFPWHIVFRISWQTSAKIYPLSTFSSFKSFVGCRISPPGQPVMARMILTLKPCRRSPISKFRSWYFWIFWSLFSRLAWLSLTSYINQVYDLLRIVYRQVVIVMMMMMMMMMMMSIAIMISIITLNATANCQLLLLLWNGNTTTSTEIKLHTAFLCYPCHRILNRIIKGLFKLLATV